MAIKHQKLLDIRNEFENKLKAETAGLRLFEEKPILYPTKENIEAKADATLLLQKGVRQLQQNCDFLNTLVEVQKDLKQLQLNNASIKLEELKNGSLYTGLLSEAKEDETVYEILEILRESEGELASLQEKEKQAYILQEARVLVSDLEDILDGISIAKDYAEDGIIDLSTIFDLTKISEIEVFLSKHPNIELEELLKKVKSVSIEIEQEQQEKWSRLRELVHLKS